jgi:hypothetical protein
MDRSINQRIAPKGKREPGMLLDGSKQTLMGHDRHFTRTDGGHRVIHGTHQQCAQITAVTGDQEGRDLTTAATEQIVTTGDPGADQVDLGGLASLGTISSRGPTWRTRSGKSAIVCRSGLVSTIACSNLRSNIRAGMAGPLPTFVHAPELPEWKSSA